MRHSIAIVLNHDLPELQMQLPHLIELLNNALLLEQRPVLLLQLLPQIYYDIFQSHYLETVLLLLFCCLL